MKTLDMEDPTNEYGLNDSEIDELMGDEEVPQSLIAASDNLTNAIVATSWRGAQQVSNGEASRLVPPSRWDVDANMGNSVLNKRFGAFVDGAELFDHAFFGFGASEGAAADPQQRLLLEGCWEVLQQPTPGMSAFTSSLDPARSIAVSVGISYTEYYLSTAHQGITAYSATAGTLSVACGRISYTFGLKGPAVSIDTACSSSLVGMHLAHNTFLQGGANSALVAGVNLTLRLETTAVLSKAGMLTIDGRCKTLDAAADGYARAEACVVHRVDIMTPNVLSEAAGIVAILGTSVNQDGRSSSLTAPNGPSQQAVIRAALQTAGNKAIEAPSILEMHGTGTALGDPIEVGAVFAVMQGMPGLPLELTAAKCRLLHAEPAAGSVGLVMLLRRLAQDYTQVMQQLRTINPHIQAVARDYLNAVSIEHRRGWILHRQASAVLPGSSGATSGCVSSFAYQGTNSHALLRNTGRVPPSTIPFCLWQLSRLWHAASWHRLLQQFLLQPSRLHAAIKCDMTHPCLSYLLEGHVDGSQARFPSSTFLEMTTAAGKVFWAAEQLDSPAVLAEVAFGAPFSLSTRPCPTTFAVCTIDLVSGLVQVSDTAENMPGAHMQAYFDRTSRRSCTTSGLASKFCENAIQMELLPHQHVLASDIKLAGVTYFCPDTMFASLQTVHHHTDGGYYIHPSIVEATVQLAACCSGEINSQIGSPGDKWNEVLASSEAYHASQPLHQGHGIVGTCHGGRSWLGSEAAPKVSFLSNPRFRRALGGKISDHSFGEERAKSLPAWQLAWRPAVYPDSTKHATHCLLFSCEPWPLSAICSNPNGRKSILSVNAVWDTCVHSGAELCLSSDIQLDMFLCATRKAKCVFVSSPYSLAGGSTAAIRTARALACFQAIAGLGGDDLSISLITYDLQQVHPSWVAPSPSDGLLQGLCRAIFMEHRGCYATAIDLPSSHRISDSRLAKLISCAGEFAVAVRGDQEYSLRLVPSLDTESSGWSDKCLPVISSACITGATKGLGLEYCRDLIAAGACTIVSTSRSGTMNTEAANQLTMNRRVTVTIMKADSMDSAQMRTVFHAARQTLQPGASHFAHAAGVTDAVLLAELRPTELWNVAGPKVSGVNLFQEAMLPVGSALFFSSTSAVWPARGAGNYAAANAYLDIVAAARMHSGLPASSVQYGPFAGAGMAVDHISELAEVGMGSLSPREIWHGFVAAASSFGQTVYARIDSRLFVSLYTSRGRWSLVDDLLPAQQSGSPRAQGAASAMSTPDMEAVARMVREIASNLIGSEMTVDGHFPPGSFDSLVAMELSSSLSTALGITLQPHLVFDYPSVDAMATHISTVISKSSLSNRTNNIIKEQNVLSCIVDDCRSISIVASAMLPSVGHHIPRIWVDQDLDAIDKVPCSRWDLDAHKLGMPYHRVCYGGFLQTVDLFDATLFGIAASEADLMDPQQRLLLEVVWPLKGIAEDIAQTGVYVGIQQMEYAGLAAPHMQSVSPFAATSSSFSVAAGRISFTYGFKGPSVSIDTACSSALVATHSAAGLVLNNPRDACLACGINLMLSEATSAATQVAGMLTMDGRCKTMDQSADGYARSEACTAFMLAAPASQDGIMLLAGSCVNQDGRSSSLTAPNGPSQQSVIRGALLDAGLKPTQLSSLEMHGTGTPLGDPIEVGAAVAVLHKSPDPFGMTAAKSRMGHSEPVAGAVGILHMAAILADDVAGSIMHLRRLNPMVESLLSTSQPQSAVHITRQPAPRAPQAMPRGSVSAFAFQGTNAHAIVHCHSDQRKLEHISKHVTWQRRRHWLLPMPLTVAGVVREVPSRSAVKMCLMLQRSATSYLWDHQVQGRPILPGAAMLEAACASSLLLHDPGRTASIQSRGHTMLLQVSIPAALMLAPSVQDARTAALDITLELKSGIVILSSGLGMQRHLVGSLAPWTSAQTLLAAVPVAFKPMLQCTKQLSDRTALTPALAAVALTHGCGQPKQHHVHPAVLDSTTQVGAALTPTALQGSEAGLEQHLRLPVGLAAYMAASLQEQANPALPARAQLLEPHRADDANLDYQLCSASYTYVHIGKMQFKRLPKNSQPNNPQHTVPNGMVPMLHPGAECMEADASLHMMEWQCDDRSILSGTVPSSCQRCVSWKLGNQGPNLTIATDAPYGNLCGLQTCLSVVQAIEKVPAMLLTQAHMPNAPLDAAICAGAGALLRVAMQEGWLSPSAHFIRDAQAPVGTQSLTTTQGIQPTGTLLARNALIRLSGALQTGGKVAICAPAATWLTTRRVATSLPDVSILASTFGGAVILTGGLGELAQQIIAWTDQNFSCNDSKQPQIWMLSKSGRTPGHDGTKLSARLFRVSNIHATVHSCDSTSTSDVAAVASAVQAGSKPLSAVLHTAAVLQDALLPRQTSTSMRKVQAPKVTGFLRLACSTAAAPVQCNLQFSSISALLGTAGQANYAAANSALDALAHLQSHAGIPVVSLMWGPWAGGMAAQLQVKVLEGFQRAGLSLLYPAHGLALFEAAMSFAIPPAASLVAARLDISRLLTAESTLQTGRSIESPALRYSAERSDNIAQSTASTSQDTDVIARSIADIVHNLIGDEPPHNQPLMEAGLGSLEAVDLREVLQRTFRISLPATVAFDFPTIHELASFVTKQVPNSPSKSQMKHSGDLALQSQLQSLVLNVMGKDVSPDLPLMEAGLDSLGAVELRNMIAEAFRLEIPATFVFDHPTILAISAAISSQLHALSYTHPLTATLLETVSMAAGNSITSIVGVSARFSPISIGLIDYWGTMSISKDVQQETPLCRWDVEHEFDPAMPSTKMASYVRFGAFCDDIFAFDNSLFSMAKSEATTADPQHRLLLEQVATAAADAGKQGPSTDALTGVFVGCMYEENTKLVSRARGILPLQAITGSGASYMVGRVGFVFGHTGPCTSIDTACSSSLVAVHLGRTALSCSECDVAMAGGVNAMLLPETTAAICQLQALSPVGRCKSFDALADGYGRGEGFAVVTLRNTAMNGPEIDLQRHAVIMGSAVNSGGRSSGLTAPSGRAQTSLITAALKAGGLQADQLAIVSVHGTGTPLGDPIELGAVVRSVGSGHSAGPSSANRRLMLASSKSCYGHTEGAAGISGLLTAVATAQQLSVPAIMHLRDMNRYVASSLDDGEKAESIKFAVPRQMAPSIMPDGAVVGASSFGMSGINAHLLTGRGVVRTSLVKNMVWLRDAHTILAKSHKLLHAVTIATTTPRFASTASSLAIANGFSIFDISAVPLASLLEMAAAATICTAADVGRAAGTHNSAALSHLVAPTIIEVSNHQLEVVTCTVQPTGIVELQTSSGAMALSAIIFATTPVHVSWNVVAKDATGLPTSKRLYRIGELFSQEMMNDGFVTHPAHLQAVLGPHQFVPECRLPVAVDGVVMYDFGNACTVRQVHGDTDTARLTTDSKHVAVLHGIQTLGRQHVNIKRLQHLSINRWKQVQDLTYNILWLAEAVHGVSSPRPVEEQTGVVIAATGIGPSSTHTSSLRMNTTFSLMQLLRDSKEVQLKEIVMVIKEAIFDLEQQACCKQLQPDTHPLIGSMVGMLKNIPYELPQISGQILDLCPWVPTEVPIVDNNTKGVSQAGARAGIIFYPRICYANELPPFDSMHCHSIPVFMNNRSCAITGGLGGLGMLTAAWASLAGLGSAILLGRSTQLPVIQAAQAAVTQGINVGFKCDASFIEDNAAATWGLKMQPCGIFHAAGLQVEARLLQHLPSAMRQTLAPKLTGASKFKNCMHLEGVASSVLFSSVSALAGYMGHANYAAANIAIELVASSLNNGGNAAVAVQWGAWSAVGMFLRTNRTVTAHQVAAMGMLTTQAGLGVMDFIVRSSIVDISAKTVIGVAPLNYWKNLLQHVHPVPSIYQETVTTDISMHESMALSRRQPVTARHTKSSVLAVVETIATKILGKSPRNDTALVSQGMDSLASLELRQQIQEAFGFELVAFGENSQDITIMIVVEELLHYLETVSVATVPTAGSATYTTVAQQLSKQNHGNISWISPAPFTIKMRLFCFPYAGGVAENLYSRWSMMLPACIQVCPVEIPGRGRRADEPALDNVAQLAKLLAESLPLQEKPYALFGTCLGAILAYELAQEVERTRYAPSPLLIFAAAASPPHLYADAVARLYAPGMGGWAKGSRLEDALDKLRGWHELPREQVLNAFRDSNFAGVEEMARNEALFQRVAPLAVNDIIMAIKYKWSNDDPLSVPIIALDGRHDNTITRGNMRQWRQCTSSRFKVEPIYGDHYFIASQYQQVVPIVTQECLQMAQKLNNGILGQGHSWIAEPDKNANTLVVKHPDSNAMLDRRPATTDKDSIDDFERQIMEIVKQFIPNPQPDTPLLTQGLDSLATLELRQQIQNKLAVELVGLVDEPQAATIRQLAQEAASALAVTRSTPAGTGHHSKQNNVIVTSWIAPAPVAIKMRLFCLPYAGGVSENLFARWSMILPACIHVCPVELPGRGRQAAGTPMDDVRQLAKHLANHLPLSDKPYAIFGTCLGAIIGYELVRQLERSNGPLPLALFPAACSPPHLYSGAVARIFVPQRRIRVPNVSIVEEALQHLRGWRDLPREQVLDVFRDSNFAGLDEMTHNEALFQRVAPMAINDMVMALKYSYEEHPPLPVPIVFFDGLLDNTIPRGYMKQWRRHTSIYSRSVPVQGDHYFVTKQYHQVLREVGSTCLALLNKNSGILGSTHSWVGGAPDVKQETNKSEISVPVLHHRNYFQKLTHAISFQVRHRINDIQDMLALQQPSSAHRYNILHRVAMLLVSIQLLSWVVIFYIYRYPSSLWGKFK